MFRHRKHLRIFLKDAYKSEFDLVLTGSFPFCSVCLSVSLSLTATWMEEEQNHVGQLVAIITNLIRDNGGLNARSHHETEVKQSQETFK